MNRRWRLLVLCLIAILACGSTSEVPSGNGPEDGSGDSLPQDSSARGPVVNEDFTGRQIFPPDNWWNLDVSGAPVDPNSDAIIQWIGPDKNLHPDFGPPPYGIPYVGVPGDQPLVPVIFTGYPDESDPGAPGRPEGYPIPPEAITEPGYIEGNVPGGGGSGDRHCLLVDRDHWLLFELYGTHWDPQLQCWKAASGAVFDLSSNARRPEGWTSADAAGLAVFPGLLKYDEVYGPGEIRHALRFTLRASNGYVWPASHSGGSTAGAPPMGMRLRLKASFDLSPYPPVIQKIFRAMQRYGLILADNGSDLFVQGTMDPRWNNDVLNPAFHGVKASDFEVIELGWNP
jgi:hypothetical protein